MTENFIKFTPYRIALIMLSTIEDGLNIETFTEQLPVKGILLLPSGEITNQNQHAQWNVNIQLTDHEEILGALTTIISEEICFKRKSTFFGVERGYFDYNVVGPPENKTVKRLGNTSTQFFFHPADLEKISQFIKSKQIQGEVIDLNTGEITGAVSNTLIPPPNINL